MLAGIKEYWNVKSRWNETLLLSTNKITSIFVESSHWDFGDTVLIWFFHSYLANPGAPKYLISCIFFSGNHDFETEATHLAKIWT